MLNDFVLFLTPSAESFLKEKVSEEHSFKLEIKNSGCSGYKYNFGVIKKEAGYIKIKGINFNIKEEDKEVFNGLLIDYKSDGLNKKLVFENPNAQHECGCGESFALKRNKNG